MKRDTVFGLLDTLTIHYKSIVDGYKSRVLSGKSAIISMNSAITPTIVIDTKVQIVNDIYLANYWLIHLHLMLRKLVIS